MDFKEQITMLPMIGIYKKKKPIIIHTGGVKKMEHKYILCVVLKLDIDTLTFYCQDILI